MSNSGGRENENTNTHIFNGSSASNFHNEIQILGLSEITAKLNQSIVYTTNSWPYNLLTFSKNKISNALAKSLID